MLCMRGLVKVGAVGTIQVHDGNSLLSPKMIARLDPGTVGAAISHQSLHSS